MKKLLAALTGVALVSAVAVSSPASADKKGVPAESGVVTREDPAVGGHVVGPLITDVGGVDTPLVVFVGRTDVTSLCSGAPPDENGVIQFVDAPSGNRTTIVHNSDAPVVVYDVSDVEDEDDFFFQLCVEGTLEPFASGTVKQRPILTGDQTGFTLKVKSMGVVTDGDDNDWKLQTFLKEETVFGEPDVFNVQNQWVTLRPL